MIGVIDLGCNNLLSLIKAISDLGGQPRVLSESKEVTQCEALILPGVGNFQSSSDFLHAHGWVDAISSHVSTHGKPIFGICLGMQLLATEGYEGLSGHSNQAIPGLNLIPGKVLHLREISGFSRLPHVGWNTVSHKRDPLFLGIPDDSDFYFVHNYFFEPQDLTSSIATSSLENSFSAAIRNGPAVGVQFHPEKSSSLGRVVLRNFVNSI